MDFGCLKTALCREEAIRSITLGHQQQLENSDRQRLRVQAQDDARERDFVLRFTEAPGLILCQTS